MNGNCISTRICQSFDWEPARESKMLDKLALQSRFRVDISNVTKRLQHVTPIRRLSHPTRFHRECWLFSRSIDSQKIEQLLAIHLNPTLGFEGARLELNPSRFRNFEEMASVIAAVVPIESARVVRIDHAVDVKVPLRRIFETAKWPRKSSREVWAGSNLTGLYFGKRPERLVCYDKARELGMPNEVLSRIELQQHNEKVPLHDLENLSGLTNYSPFKHLKFSQAEWENWDPTKLSRGGSQLSRLGMQGFYKEHNRHSNFRRDYSHLFGPCEDIPDLDKIYQSNLSSYFLKGGSYDN